MERIFSSDEFVELTRESVLLVLSVSVPRNFIRKRALVCTESGVTFEVIVNSLDALP